MGLSGLHIEHLISELLRIVSETIECLLVETDKILLP